MLGFFIGTACLVALFATVKRRHHGYGYQGFGERGRHGWGGGFGAGSDFGFRRRGRMRGRMLRGLFEQLDTTPGQEKAIMSTLEAAREQLSELRPDLRKTKRELAALLGSDVLDRAALEDVLGGHQVSFDRARAELVQTMATIHEILDTQQRRELGELLADGTLGQAFGRGRGRC